MLEWPILSTRGRPERVEYTTISARQPPSRAKHPKHQHSRECHGDPPFERVSRRKKGSDRKWRPSIGQSATMGRTYHKFSTAKPPNGGFCWIEACGACYGDIGTESVEMRKASWENPFLPSPPQKKNKPAQCPPLPAPMAQKGTWLPPKKGCCDFETQAVQTDRPWTRLLAVRSISWFSSSRLEGTKQRSSICFDCLSWCGYVDMSSYECGLYLGIFPEEGNMVRVCVGHLVMYIYIFLLSLCKSIVRVEVLVVRKI